MTTVNEDIDAIVADPKPLALESGFPIKVLRIRTRATMALLKILTRGAGDALFALRLGSDTSQDEFIGGLLGAVLFSIPEAVDETIEFVNLIVEPGNLNTNPRQSPGDIEYNADQEAILRAELADPSLEDLVTIVEAIVKLEGPHVLALGKRLAALFPTALATEQKKDQQSQKPARKAPVSSKKSSEG